VDAQQVGCLWINEESGFEWRKPKSKVDEGDFGSF
jgi:hypothetical protein